MPIVPLAVCGRFYKLVTDMFPDYEIAAKYQCGWTKATAIRHALSHDSMMHIAETLREGVFFLRATDGSYKNYLKLYPMVIRMFDMIACANTTKSLCLQELLELFTSTNRKDLLINQLKKLKFYWIWCRQLKSHSWKRWLNKFTTSKELSQFQTLYNEDVQKILKYYPTGCCHFLHI